MGKLTEQLPAATVPVQESPTPSLTVTLPVGVPPLPVTVKVTATACPTDDGLGVCPVMVVVLAVLPPVAVPVRLTVCAGLPEGSEATLSVAVLVPPAVGANVT